MFRFECRSMLEHFPSMYEDLEWIPNSCLCKENETVFLSLYLVNERINIDNLSKKEVCVVKRHWDRIKKVIKNKHTRTHTHNLDIFQKVFLVNQDKYSNILAIYLHEKNYLGHENTYHMFESLEHNFESYHDKYAKGQLFMCLSKLFCNIFLFIPTQTFCFLLVFSALF